jgi:RpiB/LacA/LacB family sugar-phosphate isomerase
VKIRLGLASDHGGFELKEELKTFLISLGTEPVDLGTCNGNSVDYPDFGILLAGKVSRGELDRGILLCGTGIGMSIVANKFPGIRAALVHDLYCSRFSREHNDSNILVMGGRVLGKDLAQEIVRTWLETPFAGGRHQHRLDMIERLERENFK